MEIVRALPATTLVLDGEAIALDATGRPRPFQETASRTAMGTGVEVTPYFFDLLHLDGVDLLDEPGHVRSAALDALVPEAYRVPRLVTSDPAAAQAFVDEALAGGHEGVVVKDLDAPYDAGRRGSAWVKVKPVHTLDLVVLAVEWGSGRREGWLSNIHLGARDGRRLRDAGQDVQGHDRRDAWTWQTKRFTELALEPAEIKAHYVVRASAPSRSSRSPSTASSAPPATPAGWRCGSPASSATATTRRPPRPTRSTPSASCSAGSERRGRDTRVRTHGVNTCCNN